MVASVANARKANPSGENTKTTTSFDSTAGSTIWVGVSDQSGQGALTISDNNGNTFTQIGTTQTSASGAQIRRYRAFNISGRTGHTVTATWGSNSDATVHVLELASVDTSPLDVSAQNDDNNPRWTITSPTLTQADSIAIALTGTAHSGTWDESTGFTIQTQEGNNGLYWTGCAASRVVNATTALTPSFDISDGGSNCAVSIDIFKASAGGGTVSASASQTAAGVGQTASATVAAAGAAGQTLAGVTQASASTVHVAATAAQTLAGVSSASTGTVSAAAAAAQTLPDVSQAAEIIHAAASAAATQALASVAQAGAAVVAVSAAGSQALGGVSQNAGTAVTVSIPGGAGGAPASRYLRMAITSWVFNGTANFSDLGDVRVRELQFFEGATQYPTVPMTTNTAPSPLVASSSGALTGFGDLEPWNAFNQSTAGNQWMGDGTVTKYLQIDLGSGTSIVPTEVKVAPDNAINVGGGYYITGFRIEGSNTGSFTGEQYVYLTVTGIAQSDWTADTLKTFTTDAAPGPVLQQTLAGVIQSATGTVGDTRSVTAAQTLASAAQGATAAATVLAAAAQALSNVSQTATGAASQPGVSAAQILAGVAQAAAAAVAASASAVQALAGVSQAAEAVVLSVLEASAAQTLESAAQAATAQAIANASGSQTLTAVAQAAALAARADAIASQLLAGVLQVATGTVADTVHLVSAAQLLANVTQVARAAREYVYSATSRTYVVNAEDRVLVVPAEDRTYIVAAEDRTFIVNPEDRPVHLE